LFSFYCKKSCKRCPGQYPYTTTTTTPTTTTYTKPLVSGSLLATGNFRNNLVQTFDNFGPDFTITFDLKITKLPVRWHNILHLTTGESCCAAGTRIPGVWLYYHNGKPFLRAVITMTTSGSQNLDILLEMNRQYSVELVQKDGVFSLKVIYRAIGLAWPTVRRIHSGSASFQNVKFYWSNKWDPSAREVAVLSRLIIHQGHMSTSSTFHQG
jgi:hypothetical protein